MGLFLSNSLDTGRGLFLSDSLDTGRALDCVAGVLRGGCPLPCSPGHCLTHVRTTDCCIMSHYRDPYCQKMACMGLVARPRP